jgi:hypothetical protein
MPDRALKLQPVIRWSAELSKMLSLASVVQRTRAVRGTFRDESGACELDEPDSTESCGPPAGFEPATIGLGGGTARALCSSKRCGVQNRHSYQRETMPSPTTRLSRLPAHFVQPHRVLETLEHRPAAVGVDVRLPEAPRSRPPPAPALAAIREAMMTVDPKRSPPSSMGSPALRPTRTPNPSPSSGERRTRSQSRPTCRCSTLPHRA